MKARIALLTAAMTAAVGSIVGVVAAPAQAGWCGVSGSGVYATLWCDNTYNAWIRSGPSITAPWTEPVDYMWTTNSWFACWTFGEIQNGNWNENTWYYTQGDMYGNWGWMAGIDIRTSAAFNDNPSAYGLDHC